MSDERDEVSAEIEQRRRAQKCDRIVGWMLAQRITSETAANCGEYQWLLMARQAGAAGKYGDRVPSVTSRAKVLRALRGHEARQERRSRRAS